MPNQQQDKGGCERSWQNGCLRHMNRTAIPSTSRTKMVVFLPTFLSAPPSGHNRGGDATQHWRICDKTSIFRFRQSI